jgi:hypothetical protein
MRRRVFAREVAVGRGPHDVLGQFAVIEVKRGADHRAAHPQAR